MDKKHYSFYQNTECEFFPCHKGIDEKDFNCLFCYCPLYALGKDCGGNYRYNDKGIKVCSDCVFPHDRGNYDKMIEKTKKIVEIVRIEDE
ncbi:MAG: cysteine-rich small domain-containing protein [Eubacterium sp.]|nr:cysteine-rich small domain-containing protein [Eubacterium sp.]